MKKQSLVALILMAAALCGTITAQESLDARFTQAVDALFAIPNRPASLVLERFTVADTGTTSAFSTYLAAKVTPAVMRYAEISVAWPRPRSMAAITGSFAPGPDGVAVSLALVDGAGTVLTTSTFAMTQGELDALGLVTLPANRKTLADIKAGDALFAVPDEGAKPFALTARANSVTGTYYDGETMTITLLADKDCYFKVYQTDVDGKIQLIYPGKRDGDNRLRANKERTIPDKTRFVLGAPFGEETILVVASPRQFANLAEEMVTPTQPVTGTALAGAKRGLTVEDIPDTRSAAAAAAGTAAVSVMFHYTILPLNTVKETLSYKAFDDMRDAVKGIKRTVEDEGGTFSGNEKGGTFTIGTYTGTYTVSNGEILLTVTHPREQSLSQPAASNTRRSTRGLGGGGYNFSFSKPANVPQAVSTVRGEITKSGGSFNGDETGGEFSAKGITGQYAMTADLAIVTIISKPKVFPNSLIEKEVKKFFGVR